MCHKSMKHKSEEESFHSQKSNFVNILYFKFTDK